MAIEELLPCSTSLRCMCGTTCHSVAKQDSPHQSSRGGGCLRRTSIACHDASGPYSERHLPSRSPLSEMRSDTLRLSGTMPMEFVIMLTSIPANASGT